MIAVELFYHCDRHGCSANAYVPGEVILTEEVEKPHDLPKDPPPGWGIHLGRVFCPAHKEKQNGETAMLV